jgi:transposase
MGQTPRSFGSEFKLELMRQWSLGETTCAKLCREHRLAQSVLYRWRDEYRTRGEDAFTEQTLDDIEVLRRRVADLERALGQATLDNQLLKRGLQLVTSRSDTP